MLHINPLDAHKVLGRLPLPLTPVGWAWGAYNNRNDKLFTLNTITIFYRDVWDVETVLKASLIRESILTYLAWLGTGIGR